MADPNYLADQMIYENNFITENLVSFKDDDYVFNYHFLILRDELSAANGYDIIIPGEDPDDLSAQNIEYATFSATTSNQQALFSFAFFGSPSLPFSVLFMDVVDNLRFEASTANAAHINMGQVLFDRGDGDPDDMDRLLPAYAKETLNTVQNDNVQLDPNYPYSQTYTQSAHGDIWLNSNFANGWNDTALGHAQFWSVIHEVGHILGLSHPDPGGAIDNQKYTMMSYMQAPGMASPVGSFDVYPSGLQLYDILALQKIFGSRNYAEKSDNTVYTVTSMNFSTNPDQAFLYTIWDGAGNDTIDVRTYDSRVQIDLRQGHFSSIGKNVFGFALSWDDVATATDPDPGNVAIAFHTVIENAVGTDKDDVLIGNAWNNTLTGGKGNDTLYGDGIVYDGDAGFADVDPGDALDPNRTRPQSDNDFLFGGEGDDQLFGGVGDDFLRGDAGNDTIDGGDGNDTADYSAGPGIIAGLNASGDSFVGDGLGGIDILRSIENVTGSSTGGDLFHASAPAGRRIDGRGGIDSIDYGSAGAEGLRIDLLQGLARKADGTGSADTLIAIENATGTTGKDLLVTGDGANVIDAGAGDDRIMAGAYTNNPSAPPIRRAGNDIIDGGDGIDTIDFSLATFTTVNLATGTASDIFANSSTFSNIENVKGSRGEDMITGNVADNILEGGDGNDTFILSGGNDTITGGAGIDRLIQTASSFVIQGAYNLDLLNGTYARADGSASGTFTGIEVFFLDINMLDARENGLIPEQRFSDVTVGPVMRGIFDGNLLFDGIIVHTDGGKEVDTFVIEYHDMNVGSGFYGANTIAVLDNSNGAIFENSGEAKAWIDFSAFEVRLIIDALAGTVTDRSYIGRTVGYTIDNNEKFSIVGTDHGDEIKIGNGVTVWGGKGDDKISRGEGEYIYSGGVDTFSFGSAGSFQLTMAPDIARSAVEVIKTLEAVSFGPNPSTWFYQYRIDMEIAGHGKIIGVDRVVDTVLLGPTHLAQIQRGNFTHTIFSDDTVIAAPEKDYEDEVRYLNGVTQTTPYDDIISGSDVNGASGNDQLTGTSGNDTLNGGMGDDRIEGGDGNDLIIGGFGDDTLIGGGGDDIIVAGDGNDTIEGGAGNDTIYGGTGNDVINGGIQESTLIGGSGDDDYIVSAAQRTTIVDASGASNITVNDRLASNLTYSFTENGFNLSDKGAMAAFLSMPDTSSFLSLGQNYLVLSDNSTVEMLRLFYSVSDFNDTVNLVNAGIGATIDLKEGNDQFSGTLYDDNVFGGNGNDILTGSNGNDSLNGGGGDDTLTGGQGNDAIDGGVGFDTVSYSSATHSVTVNLQTGFVTDDGLGGNDTLTGIENYQGSSFGDTFIGSDAVNTILTRGGNDIITAGKGDDIITDFGGDDTYIFRPGDGVDRINDIGGVFTLRVQGQESENIIFSRLGNDLSVQIGSGVIFSNFFASSIGNARMIFDDNSTINLSTLGSNQAPVAEDDLFSMSQNSSLHGNVLLDNGNGLDRDPDGSLLRVFEQSLQSMAGGTVSFSSSGDFVYTAPAGFTGVDSFSYTLLDDRQFSDIGNVSITVLVNHNPVAQDDNFISTLGRNLVGNLLSDNGNGADSDTDGDALTVQAGAFITAQGQSVTVVADGSFIYAPAFDFFGSDSFAYAINDGHGGTDTATVNVTINLPAGAKVGHEGADFIFGGRGDNVIVGQGGNDSLFGGKGNDTILGGNGSDSIFGGQGSDKLSGGAGDDFIYADGGRDELYGGAGDDWLMGSGDNDTLQGDAGRDTLFGGGGRNTYIFERDTAFSGADTIMDFDKKRDQIDISDVLHNFDPLHDAIAHFVKVTSSQGKTTLSVDADGADNGAHFVAIAIIQGAGKLDLASMINQDNLVI